MCIYYSATIIPLGKYIMLVDFINLFTRKISPNSKCVYMIFQEFGTTYQLSVYLIGQVLVIVTVNLLP